jgi:hypothetical protein
MDEVLDPGMLPEDFSEQATTVARQRKVAELLRKQAMERDQPKGQMISGRYVGSSPYSHIANALANFQASSAERGADAAESDMARRAGAARQQWASKLPQAVAAQEQKTAPFMAPGMDGEENIPGTSTITQRARPAQPVTTGQILKHAVAGRGIPGNKEAVDDYLKASTAEQNRDSIRGNHKVFIDSDGNVHSLNLGTGEADQFSGLKAPPPKPPGGANSKFVAIHDGKGRVRILDKSTGEMGEVSGEAKPETPYSSVKNSLGQTMILDRRTGELSEPSGPVKPPGESIIKEANNLEGVSSQMDDALASLKKASGDMTGFVAGAIQHMAPGDSGTAIVNKFRDRPTKDAIQHLAYVSDGIRHDRFGATFTGGEKKAAEKYLPGDYDDHEELIRKAEGLANIIRTAAARARSNATPKAPAAKPATPKALPPGFERG